MINQLDFNNVVYSAVTCNGKAYMLGTFTTVNNLQRTSFVEVDLTTGNPTSVSVVLDSYVFKAVACGTKLVMFGNFSSFNGTPARSYLLMYDTITSTFSDPIAAMGLFDISGIAIPGSGPKGYVNQMRYHENSGYLYVSGNFSFSNTNDLNGSIRRDYFLVFNPTSNVLALNPALSVNTRIRAFDFNQSTNVMYYIGFQIFSGVSVAGSLNVSNPNNVIASSWQPANITYIAATSVIYANNKVFFASNGGSFTIATINGVNYQGMVAFDGVFGALDSLDWQIYRQAFEGQTTINQITSFNGKYYVIGDFTDISLQPNSAGFQRPSFFVRKVDGSFAGENIALNGPQIIHYINNSAFYQNEPASLYAGIFDGDFLHLFGGIPWIDGVMSTSNHLILNNDGTRIQKRLAVFL